MVIIPRECNINFIHVINFSHGKYSGKGWGKMINNNMTTCVERNQSIGNTHRHNLHIEDTTARTFSTSSNDSWNSRTISVAATLCTGKTITFTITYWDEISSDKIEIFQSEKNWHFFLRRQNEDDTNYHSCFSC